MASAAQKGWEIKLPGVMCPSLGAELEISRHAKEKPTWSERLAAAPPDQRPAALRQAVDALRG